MGDFTRPSNRRVAVRRRAAAVVEPDVMDESTSAAPGGMSSAGADCGHTNCVGPTCNVHYVGPTSQLSDHHAYNASRASSHLWAAAIISGLAVVLTGVIAYSSVQASDGQQQAVFQNNVATHADVDQLFERISVLEGNLQALQAACVSAAPHNSLPTTPPAINR